MTTASPEEPENARRSTRLRVQLAREAALRAANSRGQLRCTTFICVQMCADHYWLQRSVGTVCEHCGESNEVCFQVPEALEADLNAALQLQGEDLYKALYEIMVQIDDVFIMQMRRHS